MELSIWKGEWGLGSVSSECLEALVYAKIVKAIQKAYVKKFVFTSDMSPTLWNGATGKTVCGSTKIVSYLNSENLTADAHLTVKDRADIVAYKHMIQSKLIPALNYALWCDESNYVELIRPTFAKIFTFPSNYAVPGRIHGRHWHEVWTRFGFEASPYEVETKLNRNARDCLEALSQKLGANPYFFGKKPTSFDAYIFSFLSPISKIPLPNANLSGHLKSFPNLSEFENRVHAKYVSSEVHAQEKAKPETEWIGVALSLSFAASVMLAYAAARGILEIEF